MPGEDSPRRAVRPGPAQAIATLADLRAGNALSRMAAGVISAALICLICAHWAPLVWLAGWIPILLAERRFALALKAQAERDGPPRLLLYGAWTFAQGLYGSAFAALAWFLEPRHGDAIATFYLCASALNAVITLRAVPRLAFCGLAATAIVTIALPVAEIVQPGRLRLLTEFGPLIAIAMLSGYGVYVWRVMRAADRSQMQAAAAAERAQQLRREALSARADFIALMKHEARTPMTALAGSAEVLRRMSLPPEARAHVDALIESSDVLAAVMDDLIDLDAIDSGKLALQPRRVDPAALLRSVAQAFRTQAEDKGLELLVDVADNAPRAVLLDPVRVRQILFNLTSNAVKFTVSGGVRLRLQAAPSERAGHVRLGVSVADTGVGMSRGQLAACLSDRRLGGDRQGLGLVICAKLARHMGAKIGARSTPGQGSMFSFVIEAQLAQEQPPARPPRARFLIVQHEPATRRVLAAVLDTTGAAYDVAEDGARALEMLHEARYDLVIADHDAPQFDAIDIAELLAQGGPSAAAPVIALVSDAGAAALCAESGLAGAVMKPVTPPALLDELARVIGARARAA